MMMSKPRPSSAGVESKAKVAPAPPAPVETSKPKTAEEKVEDLERRLQLLGGSTSSEVDKMEDEAKYVAPAPPVVEEKERPKAPPPASAAPTATARVGGGGGHVVQPKGGKNALLARIMAAQERAKNVPQPAAPSQQQQKQPQERKDDPPSPFEAAGIEETPPPPFEAAGIEETPPPPFEAAGIKETPPPPPPFEAAGIQETPPPLFEAVEETVLRQVEKEDEEEKESAPSAPPLEHAAEEPSHEEVMMQHGIDRVVPPPTDAAPPPTFEQFEETNAGATEEDLEAAFEFDLEGNALSPEERKAMFEEQRRILAQIQKEEAENAAAIAAAQAEAFESRSAPSVTRAADEAPAPPTTTEGGAAGGLAAETGVEEPTRTVSIGSGQNVALHGQERTKAAIADGTAILVQCMNCQNWMQVTDSATLMYCPVCSVVSPVQKQDAVFTRDEAVQLTMDRRLAERMQNEMYMVGDGGGGGDAAEEKQEERGRVTRFLDAIGSKFLGDEEEEREPLRNADGTPMTAYQVQQRALTQARIAGPRGHGGQEREKGWWESISSMVGFGVETPHPPAAPAAAAAARRRGELGTSLPPGATRSSSPSSGGLLPAQTGEEAPGSQTRPVGGGLLPAQTGEEPASEHRGLLSAGSHEEEENAEHLPAGRVAERKPLFSCIADSVAGVASSVGTALTTNAIEDDEEGNVHGVDASSLLAVTTAGREGGSGGSYRAIPGDE